MKIPVILLNYNSFADCRKCIGFLKQQENIELEIIIVDNCSTRKGEIENVKNLCEEQGCIFIAADANRGYNAGNNIGLRYAATKGYKYAVIANPDMEFSQADYFAKMVGKMEEDKEIVVCGSDIVSVDGHHQNPMFKDNFYRDTFGWMKRIFRKKHTDDSGIVDYYRESHYCLKVSGCCLLLRMDFIVQIGFFDDHLFLYCEEAVLSRQVEKAEKLMYYMAEAQAVHAHISSAKGNPVKRFENWEKSRTYFIDKYSGYNLINRIIAKLFIRLYVLGYKLHKK